MTNLGQRSWGAGERASISLVEAYTVVAFCCRMRRSPEQTVLVVVNLGTFSRYLACLNRRSVAVYVVANAVMPRLLQKVLEACHLVTQTPDFLILVVHRRLQKKRRHSTGKRAEDTYTCDHQERGDKPTLPRHRIEISVAYCCDRRYRPPKSVWGCSDIPAGIALKVKDRDATREDGEQEQ